MKRLTFSVLIILSIVFLCCIHVASLKQFTQAQIGQLEVAVSHLERDEWRQADKIIAHVYDSWEQQAFYLHTTLRHTDIDAIRTSLKEIEAYLKDHEDRPECLAAMAKLINQLELLLEAELPTIKNLL